MPVTVTPAERDLIQRVLKFANGRPPKTSTEVEHLFMNALLVRAGGGSFLRINPGDDPDLDDYPPVDVVDYRRHQAEWREALRDVASGGEPKRRPVEVKVNLLLLETVKPRLGLHGSRLILGYVFDGVQACCALALALILDESRGLRNRIGVCRQPGGCGRINLTFEGKRRVFCNERHRLKFDQADAGRRVRLSRERAKKESERRLRSFLQRQRPKED